MLPTWDKCMSQVVPGLMHLNVDEGRDSSNTKVGKPKRQRMKILMEENITSKAQGSMFGMRVNKERKYFMLLTD